MNSFYSANGVIEVGAGLALLCLPSAATLLLLARPLEAPAALAIARIGGRDCLRCWLARSDAQSFAARGLVFALVIYNTGVALILFAAGILNRPVGILLWPAVVLHTVMTAWCIVNLTSRKSQYSTNLQLAK